ncbi:MAG TPA: hypothetical protein VFZ21_12920 [Gemmatimonadaceae bacterium]|nr:hypothetical protein [Gemmatimonadaceae bacterium]
MPTVGASVTVPTVLHAQGRELERYGPGSAEARIMLYYSSTVAFSPLGAPHAVGTRVDGERRFEGAVEFSFLPPLSEKQRTAGSDKPEATNLAPLFVRPRVSARLPGDASIEVSWIPPVRFFDVKANLFAGAISRAFTVTSTMSVVPRVSFVAGRVEGPITCNRETAEEGNAALATYYATVCYGNDSNDFFEPRHLSGELLLTRRTSGARWLPYVSAGARAERTRFDVGVIRRDGSRDTDQPILEVKTTRGFGTAGASWFGVPRTRLAAELYYAPGSVLTVRGLAGVRLW